MDELEQYWNILRRRWLPGSTICGVVLALTAWSTVQQQPIYEAKGQIMLKRTNSAASLTGVGKSISELESVGNGNPTNTQAEIIRSVPNIQETISLLKLPQNSENFLKSLNVINIKATDILEVSYKHTSPKQAAAIVNTLLEVYVKNDINAQRAEARAARGFLEEQLPQTEAAVRETEEGLRKFKEQNKIVDLEAESKSTVEVLKRLSSDLTTSQAQLEAETSRVESYKQIFGMNAQKTSIAGVFGDSPTTQKALESLQDVQQRLGLERTRFSEAHPIVADLISKETALKAIVQERVKQSAVGDLAIPTKLVQVKTLGLQQHLIEDYAKAEADRASLQQQVAALAKVEAAYKERVNILPSLEQKQRQLERQLIAAQSTYKILLEKFQEIRVVENQNVGNARIIAQAVVPERPIAPRKAQNLITGALAGLLLAVAVALALEAMDKSIKTTKEAQELFGYPLLGIILTFPNRHTKQSIPEVIVRNNPGCSISEAFRMLQTNLRFSSSDRQMKVIVVTSSVSQEGKSTIAANLAVATAQQGRKVLLVDGDMRHPTQHQIWKLSNEFGLSSVLLGECELRQTVAEVTPNLDVLSVGGVRSNPSTLLDSSQMAVLIAHCSQNYDFVIIDTPPLTSAADATILGKMTDGVLLVLRPGVADAAHVAFSKNLLQQSGQTVLGLVVNEASLKSQNYYINSSTVQSSNASDKI